VIAIGLVNETTAIGKDADDSRFATVDDMRIETLSAIAIRHDGNRAPRYRRGKAAIELTSRRFTEPHTVTGDRFRRQRPVFAAGRRPG
jgi:hypothetical protein